MNSPDNQKRSIWIVGVLVVILGVFVLFNFSPLLATFTSGSRESAADSPTPTAPSPDAEAPIAQQPTPEELESRAQGYEAVLEREPDNLSALQGLLEIRLQQGDLPNAIVPLEALADLQPEQTRFRLALAQAKQQLGDVAGAEGAYRQLIESDPGELFALQGLVTLLVQQNRGDEAISEVRNAIAVAEELNTGETEVVPLKPVRFLLAQIYTSQQRYEDAIAIYDSVGAEDTSDFRPLLGKAIALQEQGNLESAKTLFERAYDLAPANFKPQIAQIGGLEAATPPPVVLPQGATPNNEAGAETPATAPAE